MAEAEAPSQPTPRPWRWPPLMREGLPNVRMVLLKGADEPRLCVLHELRERQGRELAANPKAALCFYWKSWDARFACAGRSSR